MASGKNTWDFECPQFVDFEDCLNSSGREDIYFDCKDHKSPAFDEVFSGLQTPAAHVKKKVFTLTKDDENKLVNKMDAALTIIENTPKSAWMKRKHFSERPTTKSMCQRMAEIRLRKQTLAPPAARIQRSKSVTVVDKIGADKQNKVMGLRKRSSSLGDLQTLKKQVQKERVCLKKSPSVNDLRTVKQRTYPTTPKVLKRTITKAKSKAKTTEEMELEEIAKLQKQLIAHLRYNEISLKRLHLKPRTYMNPKGTQIKEENLKEIKGAEKGLRPVLDKLLEKPIEARQNLQTLNHDAFKREAMKLNSVFNHPKRSNVEKAGKGNSAAIEVKPKNSSTASSSVSHQIENNRPQAFKKPVLKIGFHSGLFLPDNIKKTTELKPFRFDARYKGLKDKNSEQKLDASLSNSSVNLKVDDGKENIPQSTVFRTFNSKSFKGPLYTKTNTFQNPGSNKKVFEKRVANQARGLVLSENIARN